MTSVARLHTPVDNPATRYVRALAAECDDRLVGGKAHALGRMIRAGLRVPPGFTIVTPAFDDHIESRGLRDRIDALCASVDIADRASVAECSRELRTIVREGTLSTELRQELFAGAETLLACGAVVVRSSAVGEDSSGQSFAGQLDSILHVTNLSSLERAVIECWSSLWSERALFYRLAKQLPSRGMAVVVQQQVEARAAGVLFTDAGDGTMIVEYTSGFGDALVNGSIDPGRLVFDRRARSVRHVAGASAGADASGDAIDSFTLDATSVSALIEIGERLEWEFGSPQDIEWVLDQDGVICVVQSRPITASLVAPSSAPIPNGPPKAKRRVAWSNANVNENFPGPISPLLYSVAAPGYSQYFRNLARAFGIAPVRIAAMEPAFRQIIGVHGARMYYNLTSIHSVLRLAPFGRALAASFDTFVGANGADVEPETLGRRNRLRQATEVGVIAAKTAWQYRSLGKRIARFETTVDRFADATAPTRLSTMSATELRDALRQFMDIRLNRWLDASLADAASMICYGALQRLLQNAYGADAAVHTLLLKAIPNVISGEPVHRLWALSRMIRGDQELMALFERPADAVLEALRDDVRYGQFHDALAAYLNDWGFRCSEELMLTSPSFQEHPAPLIEMLRAYARLDGTSPTEALRDQEAARVAETERVLSELARRSLWRGVPGLSYARALRVLLPWTHASIRFRERARMKQALLYSRCRRIALAIGDQLAARSIIGARDDVFFLTVTELDEILSGTAMFPQAARDVVRVRRREHNTVSATTPPDAFTLPEGEYLGARAASTREQIRDAEGGALRGVSACGGRVTGRATVLRDVTEAARLSRGDVLVTRQTDPGWGPVFFLIAGLVIERGGMLSHGAIIAREFGIPCVVGVRDAMRKISDGTMITVDGDAGKVHVDV